MKTCPYCKGSFASSDLPEDFEFDLIGSWNHPSYACCNLCDAPVEEYEQLGDKEYED